MLVELQPVFIHSLFRTGSTYLWNRLRKEPGLCAYYEPFHPELKSVNVDNFKPWRDDGAATDSMNHPRLDSPYLEEFRPLLGREKRGVPLYRQDFAFADFCRRDDHPAQKQYLDSLIAAARPRRAVLQFNRSALRGEWFRRQYPGALQLYLVRHPDHQFHSQVSLKAYLGMDTFFVMDLMAAALNRHTPEFAPLNRVIPLPCYLSSNFAVQRRFYSRIATVFTREERYALFYYLWFSALVEHLGHPGDLLSIDALSLDPSYRKSVENRLSCFVNSPVEFPDAAVRQYSHPPLPPEAGQRIRHEIQARVLGRMPGKDVAAALASLSPLLRDWLLLGETLPEAVNPESVAPIAGLRPPWEIRDAMMEILGADLERHFQERHLLRALHAGARPPVDYGIAGERAADSRNPELAALRQRCICLENERDDSQRREREESCRWAERLGEMEVRLAESEQQRENREKELRRALEQRDQVRRDLQVRSLQRDKAESVVEELRKELEAMRNTRWRRVKARLCRMRIGK